jgi:hypothetical protein
MTQNTYNEAISYRDLPWYNEACKQDLTLVGKTVYIVKINVTEKGVMLYSNEYKFYYYSSTKVAKMLLQALPIFISDPESAMGITGKLAGAGGVVLEAYETDVGIWQEENNIYTFVKPESKEEVIANNPFLRKRAEGEPTSTHADGDFVAPKEADRKRTKKPLSAEQEGG